MKKIRSRILLSVEVIATLATTGSVVLSCSSSSDQQKLNGITTDMITRVIKAKLNPQISNLAPDAPIGNKFTGISINGLNDVSITISNWIKCNSAGFVQFSIVSIDKGTAKVSGSKFKDIKIFGFQAIWVFTQNQNMQSNSVKCTIHTQDNKYFVGTNIGLWMSIDNGITFTQVEGEIKNIPMVQTIFQASNGNIFVGTYVNGLWMSKDDGTTFVRVWGESHELDDVLNIYSIYQTTDGHIYLGTGGRGLWRTKDNGTTFEHVASGLGDDLAIKSIYQTSNGFIFLGTQFYGLWVSKDNGASFKQYVDQKIGLDWFIGPIYQASNQDIFIGTTNGHGLWVSKDNGTSFDPVSNGIGNDWEINSIYQASNGSIFIGTKINGLWISDNTGNIFTQVSGEITKNKAIFSIYQATTEEKLFVGTNNGLWIST